MPIGQLIAEHDRLLDLDAHVRAALGQGDEAAARGLFSLLVAILEPHMAAEERGLFAVLRQVSSDRPDVGADPLLESLEAGNATLRWRIEQAVRAGPDWPERILVILDALYKHVTEQEFRLFPRALETLDRNQWAAVAAVRATDLTC